MLTVLRERRKALKASLETLHRNAIDPNGEARALTPAESAEFNIGIAEIGKLDERIDELSEAEKREANAAAHRVSSGYPGTSTTALPGRASATRVSGGETYHRGESSHSFFRDLHNAQLGDWNAAERLQRNNQEVGLESRALGNTGATGGSGGEFAPPAWLVDDFIKLARPGRVTADLFHREDLPPDVSTVNLPRVLTGTTTAVQSTQNSALSQTDMTTAALSAGVVTIGGKQVVSQQLLDQSGTQFDRVILEDLAADYARQFGTQVLTGTGTSGQLRGFLTPSSTNLQTWTQATPTAPLFYSQLAKLQGAINTSRSSPRTRSSCTPAAGRGSRPRSTMPAGRSSSRTAADRRSTASPAPTPTPPPGTSGTPSAWRSTPTRTSRRTSARARTRTSS